MATCPCCIAPVEDASRPCSRCYTALGLEPGATLVDRRYAIVRELGRGAMGVVVLAYDVTLGRQVAIKLLPSRTATDPPALRRFQTEAATIARIRSEHVVQVYSFGAHEGSLFFAMEYVRGEPLDSILKSHADHGERIPVTRVVTIVERIAEGLGRVHAAGLVHRDVKPANVVIEEGTGRPVLVDFGLAVASESDESHGLFVGTPDYMAPEQGCLEDRTTLTGRADQYALACTAFELLAGRPPFRAETTRGLLFQHAFDHVPTISSARPDLGNLTALDDVIRRGLEKNPEDRYPSCEAFAREFALAANVAPAWRPSLGLDAAVSSRPTASLRPSTQVLKVLVVDDDPLFRRLARRAVQLGFAQRQAEITAVGSGAEALEHAATAPDLLLLDYDMPGLDGLETLSALRARPGGHRTRVVVVSGRVGAVERWRFSVMGVEDFVAKPLDLRMLVDRIGNVVGRIGLASRERSEVMP
jgi:serine/threonine-protein kinase